MSGMEKCRGCGSLFVAYRATAEPTGEDAGQADYCPVCAASNAGNVDALVALLADPLHGDAARLELYDGFGMNAQDIAEHVAHGARLLSGGVDSIGRGDLS